MCRFAFLTRINYLRSVIEQNIVLTNKKIAYEVNPDRRFREGL